MNKQNATTSLLQAAFTVQSTGVQYAETLDTIAERLGMSRARVAQIERRALEKIRNRLKAAGLTKEDFL